MGNLVSFVFFSFPENVENKAPTELVGCKPPRTPHTQWASVRMLQKGKISKHSSPPAPSGSCRLIPFFIIYYLQNNIAAY